MQNIPPNLYVPGTNKAAGSKKSTLGLTMAGGLLGMLYCHKPVTRGEFINTAFDETCRDIQAQMSALKKARRELTIFRLSSDSSAFLDSYGIAHDSDAISARCSEITRSITEPGEVQNLKNNFRARFDTVKRNVNTRTNIESRAFKAIKQSNFWWGSGIGAAILLAVGLINSRN
ncbi:MAG: hypothetical protein LBK53_08310 [Heliobacteriaceae bacterium]|jgi:hypothetical protein|nr:hypothetical protein [Heliobacteriaceae bacterium]